MAVQYCETPTKHKSVYHMTLTTISRVIYLSSKVTWYMALTIPCKRFFFFVDVSRGSRLRHEILTNVSQTFYNHCTVCLVSIDNCRDLAIYQTPSQSARNFSWSDQLLGIQGTQTFTARNYDVSIPTEPKIDLLCNFLPEIIVACGSFVKQISREYLIFSWYLSSWDHYM